MISIHDMKKLRDIITDRFGVSPSVAGRVIGYYNGSGRGEIVAAMIAGDLSGVAPALAALGVNTSENTPEKIGLAAGDDMSTGAGGKINTAAGDPGEKISGPEKISASDNGPEPVKRSARKTARNTSRTKEKNTSTQNTIIKDSNGSGGALGGVVSPAALTEPGKDQPETVAGEIVTDETHDGLPVGLVDLINSYIENFCNRENIQDMRKERQTMWKALCMAIGSDIFKRSKYLHDVQREKTQGGIYYNYKALMALCDLWGGLCYKFGKAPMVDDFARFAGVSDSMIYNAGGNYPNLEKATPARTVLLKKLHTMQEMGLSALIVDGRQNPTGALAALNHWHGWTQTREIIHTAGTGSQTAAALPVFDSSTGILPDNGGGD